MIHLKGISKSYNHQNALSNINETIKKNTIVGLVGANGAGKTTLMKIIAGQILSTDGEITLDKTFDHYSNICLLSDNEAILENYSLKEVLAFLPEYYPNFDKELALNYARLLDVNVKKSFSKLSKGQKGKFNLVIALSSRAYITLLDETYISLDAPSRHQFFDLLLEDYRTFPRTIIISTHYIDEVNRLFDDIIVLDKGKIIVHEEKDVLEEKCMTIMGPTDLGDQLLTKFNVIHREEIGKRTIYSLYDDISSIEKELILKNFEISVTPLEKWFIHLIQEKGVTSND